MADVEGRYWQPKTARNGAEPAVLEVGRDRLPAALIVCTFMVCMTAILVAVILS